MIELDLLFRKDELKQRRSDLIEQIAAYSDEIGQIDRQLKQN